VTYFTDFLGRAVFIGRPQVGQPSLRRAGHRRPTPQMTRRGKHVIAASIPAPHPALKRSSACAAMASSNHTSATITIDMPCDRPPRCLSKRAIRGRQGHSKRVGNVRTHAMQSNRHSSRFALSLEFADPHARAPGTPECCVDLNGRCIGAFRRNRSHLKSQCGNFPQPLPSQAVPTWPVP
jgi:hypothetical protein